MHKAAYFDKNNITVLLNLMKNILAFCTIIFFMGCSSQKADIPEHIKKTENLKVYSADAESNASIEMVREATFEAPGEFLLEWYENISGYSWFAGIEIDDSGRVFIADLRALKIHVFEPDGKYITSMGGEGNGPGEFSGITDTEMVSGKLYVFDFMQFRTTIFSADSLEVIESGSVRPPANQEEFDEISGWIRTVPFLRSDGTYLAGFIEQMMDARVESPRYNLNKDRPVKYYFMDGESKITSDEIFGVNKEREILVAQVGDRHLFNYVPLSFLGRMVITISDDNHTYTTWTDDFLIKIYGPDGHYQRAIYYPVQKKVVSREEILSIFDEDDREDARNYDLVQHAELPKTWPAIHSMIADDNNLLWVSTIVAEDGVREWWVLEDTGDMVGKFRWPDNRSIKAVKNGYAYVLETDKETGQQNIVQYRIDMD